MRRNKLDQRFCLRPSSHSAGRIFDRLKNLIGHFVQMGPFNILALFTRNFETSKNSSSNVLIFVRLRWLHVNGTSKRTNFQQVKNSSGAVWTQPTETKGHCSKTCTRTYRSQVRGVSGSVGILRSNDATAPRTSKRSKTTTLHVHHAFFYISLPFLHDYDVKMPNFALNGGRKQATTKVYFSFWIWIRFPGIQFQEGSPTFDKVSG